MNNNDLKITLLAIAAALVVIFSMVAYGIAKVDQTANQAHQALCTIRSAYEQSEQSSIKYLKKHPNGAPALGISAKQIEQSIKKAKTEVAQLKGLSC